MSSTNKAFEAMTFDVISFGLSLTYIIKNSVFDTPGNFDRCSNSKQGGRALVKGEDFHGKVRQHKLWL